MKVRIKKLKECENPLMPTPNMSSFIPGQYNGAVSLPIDYEIEGDTINNMEVGKCLRIERTKRNGVSALGLTVTSPLTEITDRTFTTENSVYLYEFLP